MKIDDIEVAPLKTKGRDLQEAAMVATRAFYDDPFFEYLEPHAVRRARGLAVFFRSALSGMGATGQLLGAHKSDGRLAGVAAIVPPAPGTRSR